jgi:hypothetical protein
MFKFFKLPEKYHAMMAVRALAKQGKWDIVKDYITMKTLPVLINSWLRLASPRARRTFHVMRP